jgi:hypothetical protein
VNPTLDLLNQIDEQAGLAKCADLCLRFMLARCELIRDRLSDVGKAALDVAQRYWTGLATEPELEAARVACWQELDAKSWSMNTTEPEACAARAVICLLYPRWSEGEVLEHVEWFMQLSNKAENHWVEQKTLLQHLFVQVMQSRSN